MTLADWYPGAERHMASDDGGSYHVAASLTNGLTVAVPWRLEFHTTEGDSIEGALSALDNAKAWSHLVIDYEDDRRIVQCIPFSQAARSSKNLAGGVETNRLRVLQIEIVGRAAETRTWSSAKLAWIAEVVATIVRDCGYPINVHRWLPTYDTLNYGELNPGPGEYLASTRGKQRLSHDAWVTFDGLCCHQHLPENDHWDCGALDLHAISVMTRSLITGDDDDMKPEDFDRIRKIVREEIDAAADEQNGTIKTLIDRRFKTLIKRYFRKDVLTGEIDK